MEKFLKRLSPNQPPIERRPDPVAEYRRLYNEQQMLKGFVLAQGTISTEDFRAMTMRGAQAMRFEAVAGQNMGGILTYLHKNGDIKMVLLLSRAIIPHITSAELNQPTTSKGWDAVLLSWKVAVKQVLGQCTETPDFIEIWNEPNGNIGGPSDTGLHPANYADIFRTAVEVIKSLPITNGGGFGAGIRNPASKVITGGLFAHKDSSAAYLKQVDSHHDISKAALVLAEADYIGWHPYLDSGGGLQVANLQKFINDLYTVANKPIFITEAGWSTDVVSPELQEANFMSLFKTCRANAAKVAGVLAFTLDDSPESKPPLKFGLRYKPVWNSFKSL